MPYVEKETEKLFYSIGEVAEMFGVNSSMIRYYEKEFDVIKPQKNRRGDRLFTKKDIGNFKLIFQLTKDQGLPIAQAKAKLKNPDEAQVNYDVVESLKKVRGFLVELKENL